MKLIKEIDKEKETICDAYKIRKAARAVLFNDENKIALLNVTKYGYHKLPGGGVEDMEDITVALEREAMEEVGAKIEVFDEVGITIEYRKKFGVLQFSYCYAAKVKGKLGNPKFTESEKNDGFVVEWYSLSDAIRIMKNEMPKNYPGNYIVERDLAFLMEYEIQKGRVA